MHDLRWIRDNAEDFDKSMARRGLPAQSAKILELDKARRAAQTELQDLQAERNTASKSIGLAKQKGEDPAAALTRVAELKVKIPQLESDEKQLADELDGILAALPNRLAAEVPEGRDESQNVEVRRFGTPKEIANPADHGALGEALGLIDFEAAARMSGARFTILKGRVARLERALGQFMLDIATREHGYTEYSVPLLVRDAAVFGTGQLPKFADDLFRTTDGRWLIPTSEVSLTNIALDQVFGGEDLPLRLTALTPCFRSEAGAAGKDTRGMIRQHQFWKVELVSITTPDNSEEEHERLVGCAETVLKRLELPFRTILLCAGDTGSTARKTYDLEVWLPAQNTYREISSCSNCGDFQARRMNARYRGKDGIDYVHTLNGSGVAVGRALIAVLENYQNPDGSISIPDALKPYMNGLERIEKDA
jgi:seryl-tRNA synthetase